MATGITKEIDPATQRRFDDGHRFEALARPLAEVIIGEDLYPVVGTSGNLSASFDGLTMDEAINFEHKSLNKELADLMVEGFNGADLPRHYRVQMEQQRGIAVAGQSLFMASKWDSEGNLIDERHCWYPHDTELLEEILLGWKQFEIDLAAYVPPVVAPVLLAAAQETLPAVSVQ